MFKILLKRKERIVYKEEKEMPNWCWTNVIIDGPKKEIKHLNNLLFKWTSTCNIENGFGNTWLGNIAEKAGLNWEQVSCRGSIYFLEEQNIRKLANGNWALVFDVETAWGPLHEIWHYILDKYASHCNYTYLAEEWDEDLWETNDFNKKYFVDKVAFDCTEPPKEITNYLGFNDDTYFFDKESLEKWGKKLFHTTQITYDEILKKVYEYIEKYEEKNKKSSGVCIHEIKYIEAW